MSQKKKGFYLDDEDQETSMIFNGQTQPSLYRDRDVFSAGSPSQVFNSATNQMYSQQNLSRTYNGNAFQRSTPTSMLQPQSPNSRSALSSLTQRSLHQMNPPFHPTLQQQQHQSLQKRLASSSNYGGFSQPAAYGFQSQQSRISVPSSSGDLQSVGQMSIDLSAAEFPSLTNRSAPQPSLVSGIRNYVGMVGNNTKSIDGGGEFSMQQEDFPALPAAQNGPDLSSKSAATTSESSVSSSKDVVRTEQKSMKGVQSQPDGLVTNIPNGMVTDQFGMIGLLTFLRAAESDANLVALAPGVDLTSLGLNLNSPEPLANTFQSPLAESPCRPQDIDYHVPTEYLTNLFIRDKLSPIKLNKYGEDLLFYLFYSNPGDVLQLAASTELYNREWRYHKDEQSWITRVPGMDPLYKTNTYERSHFYVFDPATWRKVVKEIHLDYGKLEDRPQGIPSANAQQQQQQHGSVSNSAIASH